MIRIQFNNDQDRIRGNYLLTLNGAVRRLRGRVFEIAEGDRKVLDEYQLDYAVVEIPNPTGSDDEVRNPLAAEL
jgi:hypothetical protein